MERYKNSSGNSGVVAFEIEPAAIVVRFSDGGTYRYSFKKPGKVHVEKMKRLARGGEGVGYLYQPVCAGEF